MKRFVLLLLLAVLISSNLVYANSEIEVSLNIEPRGPNSVEYNVVGDTFTYNINLTNLDNNTIIKNFTVCISRIYSSSCRDFNNVLLPSNDEVSLNPIRDDGLFDIFSFDASGDYRINISSKNTYFIKKYNLTEKNNLKKSFNKFPDHYTEYFDAMPLWKFRLFQKEYHAASESLKASIKTKNLTINLKNSTDRIETASLIMLLVAIISLIISIVAIKK